MSELFGIRGQETIHKLTSKTRVSFEAVQDKKEIAASIEMRELEQFKAEMQRGIALMHEIRSALETALKNLYS